MKTWRENPSNDADVHARAVSVVGTVETARRLTSSPTYVAVPAMQVHEFPTSHTCSNMGFNEAHPALLPLDSSGPTRTSDGSTAASADVCIAAVTAKDGNINEIQRLSAPLKVLHDSSCGSAPTLELQLATTVATLAVTGSLSLSGVAVATTGTGTLTVGGAAVAFSGTSDTSGWVSITDSSCDAGTGCFSSGWAAWSSGAADVSYGLPPQYRVQNSILYLRGIVYKSSDPTALEPIFKLPGALSPANVNEVVSLPAATGGGGVGSHVVRVFRDAALGVNFQLQPPAAAGTGNIHRGVALDAVYWHVA